MTRHYSREEYTIGWVCALPIELAAAQEMLDEVFEDLEQVEDDNNLYSLGSIDEHKIVIACLPDGQQGNNSAAVVVTQMKATFKKIRFGLMVGIGGGVPSEEADIRLGDVVVSRPVKEFGGVVQYDFGKDTPNGFIRTGSLNTPPPILLNAVSKIRANHIRQRSGLPKHVSKLSHISQFTRATTGPDILFEATYGHIGGPTCETCCADRRVARDPPEREDIVVHYGVIASGNRVMRDGARRDEVSEKLGGVLCFEMEAAGLMNTFPCLVIRGISDYADSHKNKKWQAYAAGTAAAYARELLSAIPPAELTETTGATGGQPYAPSYYIPFPRNPRFVGRITKLEELTQKFSVTKEAQKMTLVGLGGIGKTQVALNFAYSVKDKWLGYSVFWLPALSLESFEQACAEIARILHISTTTGEKADAKNIVQQYLGTKRSGKWLLIVDNADDKEVVFGAGTSKGVFSYLPESEDGLILFTTRHQEVAVSLTGSDVVELEKMDYKEAVEFFGKSLIRKDLLHDDTITTKLLDELDCHPLAIAQAAAYINTNKSSVSEYSRLLGSTDQDMVYVMSREFRDSTRYDNSANAVATTWLISFNQIHKYNKDATDLLAYMCCIEPKAIPRSILPTVQPEARMADAIGMLHAYYFIVRRENEDTYDIHRLVHIATRIWVEQNRFMAETRKVAIHHLAQIFPSSNFKNRELWREYIPHATRIFKDGEQRGLEVRYELSLKVGRCLHVDGRFQESLKWLKDLHYWRESYLAEEHLDRLLSEYYLASVYIDDFQIQKAIRLLEHVVLVQEKELPEEHSDRLISQNELASAYIRDNQVQKAIELLEQVVLVREKVLAEEHPSRLISQHTLASAYLEDNQIQKAIELLEHVILVGENVLPEEHLDRLVSQHQLACAYLEDNQVQRAIELLEHVVLVQEKVLAEENPIRLLSQHQLARAYLKNDQILKAIELLEYIVQVKEKVLAEEHPDRLISRHELAIAYWKYGQGQKAVELLESVVQVYQRAFRNDDPSRLNAEELLAFYTEISSRNNSA